MMVRQKAHGDIGDLTVHVEIEGSDEQLANMVYADVVGRLDELKQMVDHDIPAEHTTPPMGANWGDYLDAEGDDA